MNAEEKFSEPIKANDVVATAHTQGLLLTFGYEEDLHVQVVVKREQALGLAKDILNVIYNMGIKID